MRRDKTGDVVGSAELTIVLSRRSWSGISCGKLGIGTKKEKRSKKKETPVGTARLCSIGSGNPRSLRISSNGVSAVSGSRE